MKYFSNLGFICLCTTFMFTHSVFAEVDLMQRSEIQKALEHIENNYPRFIEKQIQISEIPAPPFKESVRAQFIASEFTRLGLKEVSIDEIGNVLGWRYGNTEQTLAISAHLDTVFPEGSDVTVKREGKRLIGKGIADDSLGLMGMLALIETLNIANIETNKNLLFVGTVGEEGLGDLRGVKYLFEKSPLRKKISAFISIDDVNPATIINGALGSKRYRISVNGTGGHSWGDFGRVNPAHALGNIMASFTSLEVPTNPKTSYNIGRIGGGTSINSIPFEAWMEVDLRSLSNKALLQLERDFLQLVNKGVAAENAFRESAGKVLTVDIKMVGDRPSGQTHVDDPLVGAALWSAKVLGFEPEVQVGSTDANIPISMQIPAIAVGGGGQAGNTHSPNEWYDPTNAYLGLQRVLLLVISYDNQ